MIGNKKILAVTLARGGSISIPKKNIALIHGKPLLLYTVREVQKSVYIDKYIVSTDDEEISQVASEHGVQVLKRPDHLSSSVSTSASALRHALQSVDFDAYYLVEVMATNPLKTVEDIDGCIHKLWQTNADSVVSVVRLYDHHPARIKWIDDDFLRDFYDEVPESRRQDLKPAAYIRNGSIYAMKTEFLRNTGSRYGKNTRPYIMPAERTINIDEPRDLIVAEAILKECT